MQELAQTTATGRAAYREERHAHGVSLRVALGAGPSSTDPALEPAQAYVLIRFESDFGPTGERVRLGARLEARGPTGGAHPEQRWANFGLLAEEREVGPWLVAADSAGLAAQ